MFGFSSQTGTKRCAVIIDVGSGSVAAAIIISEPGTPLPKFIWSSREYVIIKPVETTEIPLKEITTSLINIFLKIGSEGLRVLRSADDSLRITDLQVTISAPWTYTVTKTINYSDEKPFRVTDTLVDELIHKAEQDAVTSVLADALLQEKGLEIIDNESIGMVANGYTIEKTNNASVDKLTIAHITAITQKKIIDVVADSQNKILPRAALSTHSFMYVYYEELKHMAPDTNEACIIDVTSESTEIGIIREGILSHVTHTLVGSNTIVREIAAAAHISTEEAFTYLHGGVEFVESKITPTVHTELEAIEHAYEQKMTTLFKSTGDALSVPKSLFIHCDAHTETYFTTRLRTAAQAATGITHSIHPVTSVLLQDTTVGDTALVLSGHYFHRVYTLHD